MNAARAHRFVTADGLSLGADMRGDTGALPVLFLHGGGQTRGSWKASLSTIAALGYRTIAVDARGHGESDWSPNGDYRLETFARDLVGIVAELGRPPVIVGASLGGITALLAVGENPAMASGLVLVDVASRINQAGVDRILRFMAGSPDGFASIDDAAAAIARYNPDRPQPASSRDLATNLRARNGRFYWHWDPAFLDQRREGREAIHNRIDAAARAIMVPSLLVHAGRSDIVTADELAHSRELMPDASYVDVPSAGHMVAGDANEIFNAAIVDFLASLPSPQPEPIP